MSVEDKLREMGLSLSEPNAPVANFVPAVRTGNLLFVAGHIGFMPDGSILHPGKVGRDVTEEQAYESARQAMLNCLAAIKAETGSLDSVKRVVKLLVMVNADPDYERHFAVGNGASDLLVASTATRAATPAPPWAWPACPYARRWRWRWSWSCGVAADLLTVAGGGSH